MANGVNQRKTFRRLLFRQVWSKSIKCGSQADVTHFGIWWGAYITVASQKMKSDTTLEVSTSLMVNDKRMRLMQNASNVIGMRR